MIKSPSPFEILINWDLINWSTLVGGWERGWITADDVNRYATMHLQSDIGEGDLAAVALLASADQLDAKRIAELLQQLVRKNHELDEDLLDKWRLARLIELQSQQLPNYRATTKTRPIS